MEINNTITCEWQDNNKTLVLKGKGRLADSEWVNKVKVWYPTLEKLVISEGITSIGTGYVNEFISEKIKSLVFHHSQSMLSYILCKPNRQSYQPVQSTNHVPHPDTLNQNPIFQNNRF